MTFFISVLRLFAVLTLIGVVLNDGPTLMTAALLVVVVVSLFWSTIPPCREWWS